MSAHRPGSYSLHVQPLKGESPGHHQQLNGTFWQHKNAFQDLQSFLDTAVFLLSDASHDEKPCLFFYYGPHLYPAWREYADVLSCSAWIDETCTGCVGDRHILFDVLGTGKKSEADRQSDNLPT